MKGCRAGLGAPGVGCWSCRSPHLKSPRAREQGCQGGTELMPPCVGSMRTGEQRVFLLWDQGFRAPVAACWLPGHITFLRQPRLSCSSLACWRGPRAGLPPWTANNPCPPILCTAPRHTHGLPSPGAFSVVRLPSSTSGVSRLSPLPPERTPWNQHRRICVQTPHHSRPGSPSSVPPTPARHRAGHRAGVGGVS